MSKSRTILFALVFLAEAIISVAANAAEPTPWGKVTAIQNGWVVDRMLVFHNTQFVTNPGFCSVSRNGYIISENDPFRKTSYDMLIAAKVHNMDVSFMIEGCFKDHPRIISVILR